MIVTGLLMLGQSDSPLAQTIIPDLLNYTHDTSHEKIVRYVRTGHVHTNIQTEIQMYKYTNKDLYLHIYKHTEIYTYIHTSRDARTYILSNRDINVQI